MKKITLILLAILGFQINSNAQCSRDGSFVEGPRGDDYPIEGTAKVEFMTDGTKQVIFNNDFATIQGIRLLVFLSTDITYNAGVDLEVSNGVQLQDDNGGTDMGDDITGMKTFTIPSDVELDDYNYIIIQCVNASVTWGTVELGTATGSDCSTLSIDEKEFETIGFFPNPAQEVIKINKSNLQNLEIRIFDSLGNLVINKSETNTGDQINVSNLSTGLYLVQLTSEGLQKTERLVIR